MVYLSTFKTKKQEWLETYTLLVTRFLLLRLYKEQCEGKRMK
jgi:hypothetical protein